MEDNESVELMHNPQKGAENAVIDDLENAKMEVLNSNASTATLNMQNFGGAEFQHREYAIVTDSTAADGAFESIVVDADGTAGPINALMNQDGQFLQVDTICDNGDIYLTATNTQPLAYMVSHSHELGVASTSQMVTSHEVSAKDDEVAESAGILLDHTYEQSSVKLNDGVHLLTSKDNTLPPAHPVRTQLVPTTMANPVENQSFKTVTVTLLNDNKNNPEQTSYILLVSNDGEGTSIDNSGDVISITEHSPAAATSKSLLQAQKASDTERGACSFCEYTTTQRHLLHKHIKTHSEERPHKCPLCGNAFKTVAALNNHINTHSGKRPHKCRCCESAFTTSGELIRHIRYKHTFEKPHKCPQCDYAAVELSKMKRHIRTHTGERPYQCPQCWYASPDSYKLKRHMRTHTGEKPYACDMCSLRFTQSNSLKAHRRIHLGSKPVFQCELCPATCGRKTDLRIHMRKLHSQESVPLECRKCHKTFDDRYSYKLHLRSHEGEHTYACSLCAFATLLERKLIDHLILQHENHRPYKCMEENCEALFRFKSLLRRHMILAHSAENFQTVHKGFDCTCGKKFAVQGNQLKHQEFHAGNTILSSMIPVLQDLEDIDDLGEDLIAEVSEEIIASNPDTKSKGETNHTSALPHRKYIDSEDNVLRHRMKEFEDGDNLVMRRVVKEVKGHRVVVMEVGPSDMGDMSEEESIHDESMLAECADNQISTQFESGSSITQDAAEILYTLAAESQSHDISDHRNDELTASLASSDRIVTLELDALPDNVMSEAVPGGSETSVLGAHVEDGNLDQMSLVEQSSSVHDTPGDLMKCGVMEQQL